METLALIVTVGAAVSAVLFVGSKAVRLGLKAYKCLKLLERFLDDWFGTEEHPGIVTRVEVLEQKQAA